MKVKESNKNYMKLPHFPLNSSIYIQHRMKCKALFQQSHSMDNVHYYSFLSDKVARCNRSSAMLSHNAYSVDKFHIKAVNYL